MRDEVRFPNPMRPKRYIRPHCDMADCRICWAMRERSLTYTEIRVLSCLCMGLGDQRLAKVLGIAPSTASRHCQSIEIKLGQDDRLNVALWAIHNGLWEKPAA